MTPADFRTARYSLGLTQHGMAEALGLTGRWAWQTVSKWERGASPVPAPIAITIGLLLEKTNAQS